jgi:uncharacterized protein
MAAQERYPTHREPDRPPPLPFRVGVVSNGEFIPPPPTALDRWIEHETLARASDAADRLGLDRRRFLQGVGGMALMLSMVNLACAGSSDHAGPGRAAASVPPTTGPGGTFRVPEPTDLAACHEAFAPAAGEFIVDVHTHHVMPHGPWRQTSPTAIDIIRPLIPPGCTEADPFVCLDRVHYIEDLLLGSDTAVAILSDVPNSGPDNAPLPFNDNIGTHDFAASLAEGGQPRALVQSVIAPNFGDLASRLDGMTQAAEQAKLSSFKTYTAWGPGGQGYELDDPKLGLKVIDHARSLGVRTFCAHKGLRLEGLNQSFNHPRDLVAAAKVFPDVNFVVFHAAFETDTYEGPYDANQAVSGTNSLLKALDDYAIPPNANVWCELGTTWRTVMSRPTEAAHTLGKLLGRVGQDRVMWGTDAIWYGSPQPQIMAFRAFEITPEFQTRYGYPSLTDDLKRKIFGLNAAKLLGLDVAGSVCAIDQGKLDAARADYTSLYLGGEITEPWAARAPLTRRQVLSWLAGPLV